MKYTGDIASYNIKYHICSDCNAGFWYPVPTGFEYPTSMPWGRPGPMICDDCHEALIRRYHNNT